MLTTARSPRYARVSASTAENARPLRRSTRRPAEQHIFHICRVSSSRRRILVQAPSEGGKEIGQTAAAGWRAADRHVIAEAVCAGAAVRGYIRDEVSQESNQVFLVVAVPAVLERHT